MIAATAGHSLAATVDTTATGHVVASAAAATTTAPAVVALKVITLVLGGLITFFAARAYRQTGARPIGYLAVGFGTVTLGSLLAGAAHQAFGAPVDVVLLIESLLVAVGFGIITYSLYSE